MISRRTLLASTLPAVALSACTSATRRLSGAPAIIHGHAAPRPAKDLDHAVVYHREDGFCAWTYTRGFWDPNAWEVEPGKVGCIYYFNSKNDPLQVNGGKRHIARSIFSV